jgi:hypothetical protein
MWSGAKIAPGEAYVKFSSARECFTLCFVTDEPKPITPAEALRRQRAYAAKRMAWAEEIGRPYYDKAEDPRPPPGEVDDQAAEE